jgi:hypothetical protein
MALIVDVLHRWESARTIIGGSRDISCGRASAKCAHVHACWDPIARPVRAHGDASEAVVALSARSEAVGALPVTVSIGSEAVGALPVSMDSIWLDHSFPLLQDVGAFRTAGMTAKRQEQHLQAHAPPQNLHSRQGVPAHASATVKAGGLADFVGLAYRISAAATREAARAAARNRGTGNLIPATLPRVLSTQSATIPLTLLPTPQSATLAPALPPTQPLMVPAPCHTGPTWSSCDTIIGQNTSGSEATECLDTVTSGIASCEEHTREETRGIGPHQEIERRDTVGIHVSDDAALDQGTEATSRYNDNRKPASRYDIMKLASPWAGLQPCVRREDYSNTLDDDKDSRDRTTVASEVDFYTRWSLKCEVCFWACASALICCSV